VSKQQISEQLFEAVKILQEVRARTDAGHLQAVSLVTAKLETPTEETRMALTG